MHWTSHSSLEAATIAFYSSALVASIGLLYLHGAPRMTWFFLTLICAIRIASGVLVILYESGGDYQTDLSISAPIMLGVGIFPLMFAMIGWLYIFEHVYPSQGRKWHRWSLIRVRVTGLVALIIVIAGSVILGPLDDTASGVQAAAALVKTGTLLVVAMLGGCLGFLIALWAELIQRKVRSRLRNLIPSMLSLSADLLILCVLYMCSVIFNGGPNSVWNPLSGSHDALVRISLLPEYVIVVVMVPMGFEVLKWGKAENYSGCFDGNEI